MGEPSKDEPQRLNYAEPDLGRRVLHTDLAVCALSACQAVLAVVVGVSILTSVRSSPSLGTWSTGLAVWLGYVGPTALALAGSIRSKATRHRSYRACLALVPVTPLVLTILGIASSPRVYPEMYWQPSVI